MAEIEFADGKRVVDDVYVEPIHKVTDGEPQRFPFQRVMDMLGGFVEKALLRDIQKSVIEDHFRSWG